MEAFVDAVVDAVVVDYERKNILIITIVFFLNLEIGKYFNLFFVF